MSLRFASEQLADLRHDAQLLIECAGDQQGQLEALVAANEGDLRQAEAAVSHAADDLDVGDVRHLLSGQLERSAAGAAAAKRLLAGAHQQHAAACRLLEDLTVVAALAPKARMRCSWWMTTVTFVMWWRASSRMPGSSSELPATASRR
jgi:hypothetical protein